MFLFKQIVFKGIMLKTEVLNNQGFPARVFKFRWFLRKRKQKVLISFLTAVLTLMWTAPLQKLTEKKNNHGRSIVLQTSSHIWSHSNETENKISKKKKNENEDFDKIYNKRSTDLDVLLEDSSFYITIEILYTFSITSNFRQVQLMTL